MLFNPAAIAEKLAHLDEILQDRELLHSVISRWAGGDDFSYTHCPRPWNPGGGATLFRVYTGKESVFLKVKHLSVTVESRLESERDFSDIPSLRNEYAFLKRLAPVLPCVPMPLGYYEENDHGFLFLEMLKPFSQIERLSAIELVEVYAQIEGAVRELYCRSIVHTDIHELNILFRGNNTPVIVDFEEARELQQSVPFAESLDVIGSNDLGDVGLMPEECGSLAGYTSLSRLREVFKRAITSKLPALLRQCNFDSSCPFLNALDHGKDERIYQSVNLPGLQIEGQRQLDDERIPRILEVIRSCFDRPIVHLDIGSNLGRFNLELTRSDLISESIGVEAYDRYVELAKVLAFLSDNSKARFFCAECGSDSLFSLVEGRKIDCITIYSVYHHIRNKAAFLEDIRRLRPEIILLEMPVQPECYEGRSWQQEMDLICARLGGGKWLVLGRTSDYERPLLIISAIGKEAAGIAMTNVADAPAASAPAPTVSIILPTYNHIRYLPGAVDSVLKQSFTDFELIIVNDGSTDGSTEYLEKLTDPRITVIHQENKRLPGALNAGFRLARGKYLTWTSADNLCAPNFLAKLVEALDARPQVGFACADFACIDDSNKVLNIQRCHDFNLPRVLRCNPGMAAFLYRRECQDSVGSYDCGLEGAEDWDMWIRILERFPVCHVPEVLYFYRNHAETMTGRIPQKIQHAVHETFRKAVQRHGGALDIDLCYPALRDDADKELRALAWLDLGIHLLRSPFQWELYADQAAYALNQALCLGADSGIVAYLFAVQQARSSQWESAEKLSRHALASSHQAVQGAAPLLSEACLSRDPALVQQVPIPSLPEEIVARLYRSPSHYPATAQAPVLAATIERRGIVVLSHYYHESGGTEVLSRDIAEGLNAQGHKTDLIYLTLSGAQCVATQRGGGANATIHHVGNQEAFIDAINRLAPAAVILLTDILGDILSDLVELHFRPTFRKIVYLNVNNQAHDGLEQHPEVAAQKAAVLRKYDCVATMFEESLAVRFLKKHGISYEIVSVGIPQTVSAPSGFRRRFGIPESSPLLIYPALVAPMKNQLAVIEMERKIDHDVTVAFLGELYQPIPEYVQAFQQALSRSRRCIHLPGLNRQDVAQAMSEATICLFPSLSEGSPLTLIEAVSQGLPWLATPAVLFAAKLRGGVIAPLEDFPNVVNGLLADQVQLGKLRKEGYSFSWRHHRIDDTVQAFSNLVNTMA